MNPKIKNFEDFTRAPIYVDKTMMIAAVNELMDHGQKYLCVSRPRRFGKTIAGNMLAAYYVKGQDSRELFAPYKIAQDASFEEKRNQYNVIKIDLNFEFQSATDKSQFLNILTREVKNELREAFPSISFPDEESLARSILRVYSATDETFVIIIDEYDVLVREQVPEALFAEYLSFLNGLFKSDTVRPAISLAYLTGILPVVRDRIQSKLNSFEEFTILDAQSLAEFVGFTGDEVEALCKEHGVDYTECRRWYDGYRQHGYEIYNPKSVVEALERKRFSSYWNMTSTYKAIADRIEQNFEGTKDSVIRMLAGESIDVNVTSYMNTMDSFETKNDLFTYLIHIGYLAYDLDTGTCRIPNKEIQQEWFNVVETDKEYAVTNQIIQASKELLAETLHGNEGAVSKALDVSHIHVTSNRSYNNEDALQSAIYLAYIYALNQYTIVKEMTTGKGFADVVFLPFVPDIPAMIIELKRNGSAESAIDQIKKKQYFDSLSHYAGDLLFVGVNYDEGTKAHTCKIERFTV